MQKIILVMWNQDGNGVDADAYSSTDALREHLINDLEFDSEIVDDFIGNEESNSDELRIDNICWHYTVNN